MPEDTGPLRFDEAKKLLSAWTSPPTPHELGELSVGDAVAVGMMYALTPVLLPIAAGVDVRRSLAETKR